MAPPGSEIRGLAEVSDLRARVTDWAVIGLVFVASRLLLALVGLLCLSFTAGRTDTGLDAILLLSSRFDAAWYLAIAEGGYSAVEHAVFPGQTNFGYLPGFPLVLAGFGRLTGLGVRAAAIGLNNGLCLVGLGIVYEYARVVGAPRRAAILACILLSFAPESFVFSAPYSESLFLVLLAAACLTFRRGAYGASGLLAGALSAVRANGVFFVVFALVFLLRRDGRTLFRPWRDPARFVPIVAAPFGVFAFWLYCFWTTGDAFAQSTTLRLGWHWESDWPWVNILNTFRGHSLEAKFLTAYSLAMAFCATLLLRYRMDEDFWFCAASFWLSWSGTVSDSLIRHSVTLFPIFVALARALQGRPTLTAVTVAGFATINAMLMVAWTMNKFIAL